MEDLVDDDRVLDQTPMDKPKRKRITHEHLTALTLFMFRDGVFNDWVKEVKPTAERVVNYFQEHDAWCGVSITRDNVLMIGRQLDLPISELTDEERTPDDVLGRLAAVEGLVSDLRDEVKQLKAGSMNWEPKKHLD